MSVVIPAHNEEDVIADSVKTILGQTYANIEVIVVNDGSTDGTRAAVEKLMRKSKEIKLINFAEGHSAAFARNAGIKAMQGDVLVLHDADCVADPRLVESIVKAIVEKKVDGVANKVLSREPRTFIGRCVAAQRAMQWEQRQRHAVELKDYSKVLVGHFTARAIKALGGFNDKIFYFEDADLSKRFFEKGFRAVFEPAAVEYHQEPETWGESMRQARWFGKGLALRLRRNGELKGFLVPLYAVALVVSLVLLAVAQNLFTQVFFALAWIPWLARTTVLSFISADPLHSLGFMVLFIVRNLAKLYYAGATLVKGS